MKLAQLALITGIVAVGLSGANAATNKQAKSVAAYDGKWSVEVITDEGTCDRAYRWSLGIRGGRVVEIGDNIATASGNITSNGRVSVTLTRGQDRLQATGALESDYGSGTWKAPSRQCNGRWRAEKRG